MKINGDVCHNCKQLLYSNTPTGCAKIYHFGTTPNILKK